SDLTRNQLRLKLLKEQPHLRIGTPAFRERFVLRSIYQVGADPAILANFTGYSKTYVKAIMRRHGKLALKALRAHVNAQDYTPSIKETMTNIGRQLAGAFARTFMSKRKAK